MKKSFLVSFILTFTLIADINFQFLQGITTGRISIIVLILLSFKYFKELLIANKFILEISFLLLTFSFFQSRYSGDYTQFSRLFFFTIYCIVVSFLLAKRYNNVTEFLYSLLIFTIIQSIFLIYGFFVPSFKLLINTYFIYGGNFGADNLYRALGFSDSGVNLSIVQSFGLGAGLLLLNKETNFFLKIFIISGSILCLFSTIISSRTGLLLSILFLLVFCFIQLRRRNFIYILVVLVATMTINWKDIFIDRLNTIDNFSSDYFIEWISDGFKTSDNGTIIALTQEQKIPPLTLDLFWVGTGNIISENRLGNASGHDSGYIQTYYSLGLMFTIIFYLSLLTFIYKSFKKSSGKIIYLIFFVILILEFKEPVLFKYKEGIIFMTLLWIVKNNQIQTKKKKLCVDFI